MKRYSLLPATAVSLAALIGIAAPAFSQTSSNTAESKKTAKGGSAQLETVYVSARRREESAQDVPIPVSVIGGDFVADSGAFNSNRLKETIPSVQIYASNPRNTGINIRGLGSTFGLTNDGLDQGVGFYLDGVYLARPAATALDFIDVERIEVLRGPQGTLFGKNTTAGAFNVTTKLPEFDYNGQVEATAGNYGYQQIRGFVTGPLSDNVAGRLSISATERDGTLHNVKTGEDVNTLDNFGARGQLLWKPSDKTNVRLIAEQTKQDPNGQAQVFAGVVTTQRSAYRQFERIIDDLNYELPSRNPFDRVVDHNSDWRSGNEIGGVSLNVDTELAGGTFTSTTAWYYWEWRPSNDRDWLGLNIVALSQATSDHDQISQEFRWTGDLSDNVSAVFGLYAIDQKLRGAPEQLEEAGADQWRFLQPNAAATQWTAPGLLDGVGSSTKPSLDTSSAALFGQLEWQLEEQWRLQTGLRYNYDDKSVDFSRTPYFRGDESQFTAQQLAARRSVYGAQSFTSSTSDTNLTGLVSLVFDVTSNVNTYLTYSTSYKPVGLNLGGLPGGSTPDLSVAEVKPEKVDHIEFGAKSQPTDNTTFNLALYQTEIEDYQTLVQVPDPSLNRGYLANAEGVEVRGLEVDASLAVDNFVFRTSYAYTDGKYTSFVNAPAPLELTGIPGGFVNATGGRLPGISKNAISLSGEYTRGVNLFSGGEFFAALDGFYRSDFSSSPTPSEYLNIDSYTIVNARLGFRSDGNWSAFIWARNLTDKDYFEQLLPGSGGAGYYVAVLGDPRTAGVTLRYEF